jgi:hypothetical protein
MKYLLFLLLMTGSAAAQKPKNGTYTYSITFEEYGGKTLGSTCAVIIKGDSIKIVHNGKANLTGKKGDVMDEGIRGDTVDVLGDGDLPDHILGDYKYEDIDLFR